MLVLLLVLLLVLVVLVLRLLLLLPVLLLLLLLLCLPLPLTPPPPRPLLPHRCARRRTPSAVTWPSIGCPSWTCATRYIHKHIRIPPFLRVCGVLK